MPVRVTCPQCATQLNIRDEYAGRAVKCPKCGSVIPPAAPPSPVEPPVPPAVSSSGPPPLPEPASPPPPPAATESSRPTARPSERKPRREDDEDDDRPRRKPRRRDDDEDDDRPRRARQEGGKSGAPLILGIIAGIFLLCCGGIGGLGYYFYRKGKEVIETVQTIDPRVNRVNYDRIEEGMTPGEVEAILGRGKVITGPEADQAFPDINKARLETWAPLADQNRVALWRNGDDFLLVGFYPNVNTGKVQMKTWQPKGGFNSAEAKFVSDAEAAKPDWPKRKTITTNPFPQTPLELSAVSLAQTYSDVPTGDKQYKGRQLDVSGKVNDITPSPSGEVKLTFASITGQKMVICTMRPDGARDTWRLSRGQSVRIRGKCEGAFGTAVSLSDCTVFIPDADPSVQSSANLMIAEFTNNPKGAEDRYRNKAVTLTSAVVVRRMDNKLILSTPLNSKKATISIEATFPADYVKEIENISPGARVTVKGEFGSFSDGVITLNRCWLSP
jgi:predicted Zn finger-like uncharacterized protein